MALLDFLGRRWVLRIMWELRGDAAGFRQLQLRCDDMSPSVLSQRLRDLNKAGVLELVDDQYRLTAEGRQLLSVLAPLRAWATRWAQRTRRGHEASGLTFFFTIPRTALEKGGR